LTKETLCPNILFKAQTLTVNTAASNNKGPSWKAAIILPKEKGTEAIKELFAYYLNNDPTMRRDTLQNTLVGNPKHHVDLYLPRFSLKANHALEHTLYALGLKPIFEPRGDFETLASGDEFCVSGVTHQMRIDVVEEGFGRAVAVDDVEDTGQSIEVLADRPFIFIVFDGETGLIICQSVVNLHD
jgi:serine protease inhibitor